jgi:hypothetical protein
MLHSNWLEKTAYQLGASLCVPIVSFAGAISLLVVGQLNAWQGVEGQSLVIAAQAGRDSRANRWVLEAAASHK